MYKHFRKKIALVMALLMLFSNVPFGALAAIVLPAKDTSSTQSVSAIVGGAKGIQVTGPVVDLHIYTFQAPTGEGGAWEQVGEAQRVKNGEYLLEPEAPEVPNQKFIGWYDGEDKLTFPYQVTVAPGTGTTDKPIIGKFVPVYYVFFMDGTGQDARVFKTKEGKTGDTVTTSDVKLPLGSTQAVTGWYLNKELSGSPVSNPYTIGTANQQLWPKIEEGHYLYFNTGDGATYIEPQFVLPGAGTVNPIIPARPGYTFSRWSTSINGPEYAFGQPINADTTLYAVWSPNINTKYTVVFWKQSVNDNKNATDDIKTYDYAESVERTGTTGTSVLPTEADRGKNYQGFQYNSGKSVSVIIKGDGTTILNVYYDRNRLTIDFYRYESSSWSWVIDKTMTGLYGQTLAKYDYTWPDEYRWRSQPYSGNTLTFLDSFIFDDLPDYGSKTDIKVYRQTSSGTAQIIHYKEALDGNWDEANKIKTNGGTFNFSKEPLI